MKDESELYLRVEQLAKKILLLRDRFAEMNGACGIEEELAEVDSELSCAKNIEKEELSHSFPDELKQAIVTLDAKRRANRSALASFAADEEKRRAKNEADTAADYAASALDFALMAIDEATLAFLFAEEKSLNYKKLTDVSA